MKLGLLIIDNRSSLVGSIQDKHMPFLPKGTMIHVHSAVETSSIHGYNQLLVNPGFWSSLPFDKVLIAQHDSALLREGIEEFYAYDYVGAPWSWNDQHPGNGGLSLRTPKIMADICNCFPYSGETASGNEDVFITKLMHQKGIGKLAPLDVARKFSVEGVFALGTLGYHAIDKYLSTDQCNQIRTQYSYSKPELKTTKEENSMKKLEQKYNQICVTPSDIYYHLPTLKKYAESSKVIVELGVRTGLSTIALLMGRPEKLYSYDIVRFPEIDGIEALAKDAVLDYTFTTANDLEITIPECDMMFLDTYHTSAQLTKELALHAGRIRHFMLFHDTTTFWESGEPSYADAVPGMSSTEGLKYALEPFMAANPNWVVEYRTDENNGLLVLRNVNYKEPVTPEPAPDVTGQQTDVVNTPEIEKPIEEIAVVAEMNPEPSPLSVSKKTNDNPVATADQDINVKPISKLEQDMEQLKSDIGVLIDKFMDKWVD